MGYEIDDDGNVNNNQFEGGETTSLEPTVVGPYFDYTAFRNITTLVGSTAYLKCRVKNIGNKTVSWVRHRDIHLLTVGKFSYTSDNRFQCIHDIDAEEWILKVHLNAFQLNFMMVDATSPLLSWIPLFNFSHFPSIFSFAILRLKTRAFTNVRYLRHRLEAIRCTCPL
jgi:hypothetical protein